MHTRLHSEVSVLPETFFSNPVLIKLYAPSTKENVRNYIDRAASDVTKIPVLFKVFHGHMFALNEVSLITKPASCPEDFVIMKI